MRERWMNIPGFEGLYKVSNLGRVKRLKKTIVDSLGRERVLEEKIISSRLCNGTVTTDLFNDEGKNTRSIALLMLKSFRKNPNNSKKTTFIDGDSSNCTLSNVKYA